MGIETLATIITAIMVVLTMVFGTKYKKYKDKVTNGIALLSEVKKAYKDNNITAKELERIIDKYEELVKDE